MELDYLNESINEKCYEFVIKIAGDVPAKFEQNIKKMFEKYEVKSVKKTATTPITASMSDFPALSNDRVTTYKLDISYPIISEQVRQIISSCIEQHKLIVRSLKQEDALIAQLAQSKEVSAQDKVGNKGVSEFLKTLMKMTDYKLTKYDGVNDEILAKSEPLAKVVILQTEKVPSESPLTKVSNPNPRKGK